VGFIDIPINFLSVYWWRTLHPTPTVIRSSGPGLPGAMLATLLVSVVAFTLLYVVLIRSQVGLESAVDELEELKVRRAAGGGDY